MTERHVMMVTIIMEMVVLQHVQLRLGILVIQLLGQLHVIHYAEMVEESLLSNVMTLGQLSLTVDVMPFVKNQSFGTVF